MSEYMFVAINEAYNNWKTMDKARVAKHVVQGSITPDEFKKIVGEDYAAPK